MIFDKLFSARSVPPEGGGGGGGMMQWLMPTRSSAGINMSEQRAMMYSAVFSAVKTISETVAMLPWRVYVENGESRLLDTESTLDRVLHRSPNEEMTAFTFREYLLACALLWGNGYAEIVRSNGEVAELWPIHPRRVTVKRTERGRLYYEIDNGGGTPSRLTSSRMFHLRGPTQDGVIGWSIISLARESWGLGIAAEQFGASFFGNGGVPGLVLKAGKESPDMSREAISNMLKSFDERHKGASKAGRTAYVEPDFSVETVGMPHRDAQFIETRKLQVTDVARWFRLPPHKIADMEAATFSNIEQQSIDFVMDAIQPWTERLEQEADLKLLSADDRITKINLNGLLRGDSAARGEFYSTLFDRAVFSPNDILRLEDRNPIGPEGDKRFVPLNMVPLEDAGSGNDRRGTQPDRRQRQAARNVLQASMARMNNKENMAVTRALEKEDDPATWAGKFYSRHVPQMVEALTPGVNLVAVMNDIPQETASAVLQQYCATRAQIAEDQIAEGREVIADASQDTEQLIRSIVGESSDV